MKVSVRHGLKKLMTLYKVSEVIVSAKLSNVFTIMQINLFRMATPFKVPSEKAPLCNTYPTPALPSLRCEIEEAIRGLIGAF